MFYIVIFYYTSSSLFMLYFFFAGHYIVLCGFNKRESKIFYRNPSVFDSMYFEIMSLNFQNQVNFCHKWSRVINQIIQPQCKTFSCWLSMLTFYFTLHNSIMLFSMQEKINTFCQTLVGAICVNCLTTIYYIYLLDLWYLNYDNLYIYSIDNNSLHVYYT